MLRTIIVVLLYLVSYNAFAQDDYQEALNDTEGLMWDRFIILTNDTTNEAKDKASAEISKLLAEYLKDPKTFDEVFELKTLGKITSNDQRLNIYTWNYQHSKYLYKYGGVVQFRSSINAKPVVFELKQVEGAMPHDRVDQNKWYGCLYYKIIENKNRDAVNYTVFGWDGYNSVVSRKIVDAITVNRNGVFLGKPIFYMEKGRMNRMLFQYNSQTVMMLDYEEKNERIIFDHLSPSSPADKGDFRMYGPDSTYDGLEYKKGKWYLKKDIDLRMGKKRRKSKN